MFQKVFDVVVLGEEFSGGLGADARDTWDVVGGIAAEPQHVDDLIYSGDVPFFADCGGIEDFGVIAAAAGAIHRNSIRDELAEVFIGGDHEDFLETVGFGAMCKGSDDIVSLVAIEADCGDAECFGDAVEVGEGLGEFFGHSLAVGLVFRMDAVPLSGCGGIEDEGEVGGLLFGDEFDKGGGKAIDGGGIEAFGGRDGVAHEGKVGAICEGHAIQEVK